MGSITRSLKSKAKTFLKRGKNAAYVLRTGDFYRLSVQDVSGHKVALRAHTSDEEVLLDSFDNDIFLSRIPEYNPSAEDVVLDIGAHIGTFSLLVGPQVGKVFAIEASRETYDLLTINVCLNKLDNVTASHIALAGENGTVSLHHDLGGNWGHSITKALSGVSETVRAQTMQTYFEEHGIDRVDLAKFNCEGAEYQILLSTPPEVLKRIRYMVVLYHLDLVENSSPDQLVSHLQKNGYETRIINANALGGWIIAERKD